MKFIKPYLHISSRLALYWSVYGGWRSLVLSPYFHLAIVFTVLSSNWQESLAWADDSLQILPSLLGFSLGGFAIFLAFSDHDFIQLLTDNNGPKTKTHSAYLKICALFVHFILVQVVAIGIAVHAQSFNIEIENQWYKVLYSCIGYFLMSYAIFTTLATTLALFNLAILYNKFKSKQRKPQELEAKQQCESSTDSDPQSNPSKAHH